MAGDSEAIHAHHDDTCGCGVEWRKWREQPHQAFYDHGQLACPTCCYGPVHGWLQGPSAGACENLQCTSCGDWYWWDGANQIKYLRHGEGV